MDQTLLESWWLRLPLVLFVALAVQTSAGAVVRPFDAHPDVMLLVALCGGLAAGPEVGAMAGFITGIAFDLVLQTPFGLSALVYFVAALAVGSVRRDILGSSRLIPVFVVVVASAGAVLAEFLVAAVLGYEHLVRLHMLVVMGMVALINGVLTPLVLPVMRWTLNGRDHKR